jgi:archaellum component FlaC
MNKTWAEEMVYKYHNEIQKLAKERNQLKQQLAEKDEQLKLIKWDYDVVTREYNKLFNTADSVIERQDQDKISFAVETLKEVKESLYKIPSPTNTKATLMNDGDVFEVINNKIAELQGKK